MREKGKMKTITKDQLITFCYDGGGNRYVDVKFVKPAGFEGVDYSRQTDTDPGYRSFKFDKVDFSSLRTIATANECVLPNTTTSVSVILEKLGLTDLIRYSTIDDVWIIPKDLIKA